MNELMSSISPEIAIRHYARVKEANKRYYERNKAEIAERRRVAYHEKNPNPRPVGRPKKETKMDLSPTTEQPAVSE
jgi:hypothetical protein